jgi:WD40 repeat protein
MSTTNPNFYITGGTLQSNAASYVTRRADEELYQGLRQGKFCYVLTSRQMGKSSLMVSTAARLRAEGVAVAVLDLTAIGQNLTAEQWYDGLLNRVGHQLDLEDEMEDFWDAHERMGPLQRWMMAVREIVLKNKKGPIVFFVDEIDVVRTLPFSTDEFFAGIREFYNRRTVDPELERLTFCLLGVATPSDLIRDTRTTPFNIGQRIELTDFTEVEAAPLAHGMGRPDAQGRAMLGRILYWTGGHPYLTQRLCQSVAEDASVNGNGGVDRHCEYLFLSSRARERDDNLLFVRERMLRSEVDRASLLDLYLKARSNKSIKDDETNPLVAVLRLSGVTRAIEGYLLVRNRIYFRVFDREWIVSNMPDAEIRRQRAAYRRGMLRAASIAAVVLLMMSVLAGWALSQKRTAEQERGRAETETRKTEIALKTAHEERERAVSLKAVAEKEEAEAEKQRNEAEAQRKEALSQKAVAETERVEAERQRLQAIQSAKAREQALQLQSRAETEREQAEEENLRSRRLLYAVHMNQAQEAWEDANVSRMQKLLNRYQPSATATKATAHHAHADVRGFEWHYLSRLANNDVGSARAQLSQPGESYLTSISTDGSRAVVASVEELHSIRKPSVRVWDVSSRRELSALKLKDDMVPTALALSPDKSVVVTGQVGNLISLWDASTGQHVQTIVHPLPEMKRASFRRDVVADLRSVDDTRISSVAFSPNGRILATAVDHIIQGSLLKLWNASTMKGFAISEKLAKRVTALTFSPDGRFFVTGDARGVMMIWQVPAASEAEVTITPVSILNAHDTVIAFITFSPNGKTLATGSEDTTAKLWEFSDMASAGENRSGAPGTSRPLVSRLFVFDAHSDKITHVSFSPDGKYLATASADKTVKVWLVPENSESHAPSPPSHTRELGDVSLDGSSARIQPASYSFRDAHTASTDNRNRLLISSGFIELIQDGPGRKAQPFLTLKGHDGAVLSINFSADSKSVTTLGADNKLRTWVLNADAPWVNVGKLASWVYAVVFSPDARLLAAGGTREGDNPTVKVWDALSGKELHAYKTNSVNLIAFSRDGAKLAAACARGQIVVWDVASGKELTTLSTDAELNQADVYAISFSPDGKLMAAGDAGGSITIWDANTFQRLKVLPKVQKLGIEAVPFSPDGRLLASASHDGTVKLWDLTNWREVATINAHETGGVDSSHEFGAKAASFSPDGRFLATGGSDKMLKLWELADLTAAPILLEGHSSAITFVAFSPDGTRIITASADKTVRLWDVASQQEVAVLEGHTDDVWMAVFSPGKGDTIASAGADGTVKLWHSEANE